MKSPCNTPREAESSNVQMLEKKGDVVVWGPPREEQSEERHRIICYGDSNTAGFCKNGQKFQPYGKSLASHLEEMAVPCEVSVCGLCSFTTQDMLNERSSGNVRLHAAL